MKTSLQSTAVLAVGLSLVAGIPPATTSPQEVVERFVKMDVEGVRLTPRGWRDADALFVQPSGPPEPKVVRVIARRFAVSETPDKGDKTQFSMGYEEIGRINTSSLDFTPTNNGSMWEFDKYTLVLTNIRRTDEADKASKKEVEAPREWKIDGAQPVEMHLTAVAAMRYVTQMRDKTSDPAIKKNAGRALVKLSRYR